MSFVENIEKVYIMTYVIYLNILQIKRKMSFSILKHSYSDLASGFSLFASTRVIAFCL